MVGIGNGLGNQIVGDNVANTLSGLAGNDSLFGLGGNDNMFGGIGNDLLNGGIGADTMRGELGNDTYVVDNAGDVVIDFGAGIDRIVSSISTSLNLAGRLTVENLTLTGTAVTGVGNALNNVITGDNRQQQPHRAGRQRPADRRRRRRHPARWCRKRLSPWRRRCRHDHHRNRVRHHSLQRTVRPRQFRPRHRFRPAFDTMFLENAVFTGLTQGAFLPAGDFVIGAGSRRCDGPDHLQLGERQPVLRSDGTGAAAQVLFADLASGLALTSNDFFVV